ncbi:MAG TPA: DHHA1 domain-containing protein, partial [Phycisphaerae bacterium]|nr:DHHA1 domain-containing protein [Phycisphaerae bacterium]
MQRALASVRWSANDKFAAMLLRYADFTETGATQAQTEYLVDMPMMVGTAEVVALMSELPEGRIRVSLRSKHDIDVNKICRLFGGGGHAKAAGCRLDGPLNAAYEKLAAAVSQSLGV